jgi:hypothetical protein
VGAVEPHKNCLFATHVFESCTAFTLATAPPPPSPCFPSPLPDPCLRQQPVSSSELFEELFTAPEAGVLSSLNIVFDRYCSNIHAHHHAVQ